MDPVMGRVVAEQDPKVYLDRMRRMLEARGVTGGILDASKISAIIAEVPKLELVPGRLYRVRVLGGRPEAKHIHVQDREGSVYGLDVPDVPEPEWLEVDLRFVERVGPGTPWVGGLFFRTSSGEAAILVDMDVLRIEELDG